MPNYVGLDPSKANTSICIVGEQGEIAREGAVETRPDAIINYLKAKRTRYRRIGLEAMSFSPWLYEALAKAGLPVVCIEARHARGVLKARINKTDKNDARGIAELMRMGAYKEVHIKSMQSQHGKLLLTARNHLVRKRRDLDNLVRGFLLQSGLKLEPRRPKSFDDRASAMPPESGRLREVVDGLLRVRKALDAEIARIDELIESTVAGDPVCRRLMTAPGVGPITALAFRTTIDVPERFANSRNVGVHLGLTPSAFRSGTIQRQRRISKCGDQTTRTALYMAAQCVLRARTRPSQLKSWGAQVVASRGYKKGVVAVARRLAVILHKMWLTETDFIAGSL